MGFLLQIMMGVTGPSGAPGGGGQVDQGEQPPPPPDAGGEPPPDKAADAGTGEGQLTFDEAFAEAYEPPPTGTADEQQQQVQQRARCEAVMQQIKTHSGITSGEAEKGLDQSADQFAQVRQDQSQASSAFRMATEVRAHVRTDQHTSLLMTDRQACLASWTRFQTGGRLVGQKAQDTQGNQQGANQVRQPHPGANPLPGGQTRLGTAPQPQGTTAVPREPVPLQTNQQRHAAAQTLRHAAARETDQATKDRLLGLATQLEGEGPVDEAAVQAALSEIGTGEGEGTDETEGTSTEGTSESLGLDESQVVQETGSQGEGTGGDGAGTSGGEQHPDITLTEGVALLCTDISTQGETDEARGLRYDSYGLRAIDGGVRTYVCANAVARREGREGEGGGERRGRSGDRQGFALTASDGTRLQFVTLPDGSEGVLSDNGQIARCYQVTGSLAGRYNDSVLSLVEERRGTRLGIQMGDRFPVGGDMGVAAMMGRTGGIPATMYV